MKPNKCTALLLVATLFLAVLPWNAGALAEGGDSYALTVVTPAAAVINETAKTITCLAAAGATEQKISIVATNGATCELYSDVQCTKRLTPAVLFLYFEKNVAYMKVISRDGMELDRYTVNILKNAKTVGFVSVKDIFIDQNGTNIGVSGIDISKPVAVIDVKPMQKQQRIHVSVPAPVFVWLAQQDEEMLEIKTTWGACRVPLNFIDLIGNFDSILKQKNLDKSEVSFKFIIKNQSDAIPQSANFKVELVNTKTNESLGSIDRYPEPIIFRIPVQSKPDSYGAFALASDGSRSFVPHTYAGGYVDIISRSSGTYEVCAQRITFSDVDSGFWAAPFIEKAASKGITQGIGDGLYAPQQEVSRAEFVQMIVSSLQFYDTKELTYTDVSQDAWYYDAVAKAKAAGLLECFTGEQFYPNQAITRGEMARVLANAARYQGVVTTMEYIDLTAIYTDIPVDSPYDADLQLVYKLGLMKGTSDTTFGLSENVTRAQAAMTAIRLLEILGLIDK